VLAAFGKRTHLPGMMLDPTDEETEALATLRRGTIHDDRYPLSPRIHTLNAILEDPTRAGREALPPPKMYAPRRASTAATRRRAGR
jgi:hypothetical protein